MPLTRVESGAPAPRGSHRPGARCNNGGVHEELDGPAVDQLTRLADRLDALADTAELMGDVDGAARLRAQATGRRLRAMALLDE